MNTPSGEIMTSTAEHRIDDHANALWDTTRDALVAWMTQTAQALDDLLVQNRRQRRSHKGKQLRKGMGRFAADAVNDDALSSILTMGDRIRLMPEDRLKRIEQLCSDLQAVIVQYRKAAPEPIRLVFDGDMGRVLRRCEMHWDAMARAFRILRMAQLEVRAQYEPARHDLLFRDFKWRNLAVSELKLSPPFLVKVRSEAGASDQTAAVARLLACGYPIKVMVMRSSVPCANGTAAWPHFGAVADDVLLPVAVRGVYAAQLTPWSTGFEDHITRALLSPRPAYLSVLTLDGHGNQDLAERAVASRAFPLFELDPDRSPVMDLTGNPEPGATWAANVTYADYTVRDDDHAAEFSDPPEDWPDHQLIPVAEYLERAETGAGDMLPYVAVADTEGGVRKRVPSDLVMARARDCMHRWRILQCLSGSAVRADEPAPPAAVTAPAPESATAADIVRRLVAGLTGVPPDEIHL